MSRLFLLDIHLLYPHLAILQSGCEVGVGAELSFGLLYKNCGTSAHKYDNVQQSADLKTHSATDHMQHITTARNRPNAPPASSKR